MSIVAAIPIRLERIFQKGECVDVTFSKKPVKQEVEANYWEGFWQVTRGEAAGKFFFVVERGDISTLCDTPRATLTAAVERIEARKKQKRTNPPPRPPKSAGIFLSIGMAQAHNGYIFGYTQNEKIPVGVKRDGDSWLFGYQSMSRLTLAKRDDYERIQCGNMHRGTQCILAFDLPSHKVLKPGGVRRNRRRRKIA